MSCEERHTESTIVQEQDDQNTGNINTFQVPPIQSSNHELTNATVSTPQGGTTDDEQDEGGAVSLRPMRFTIWNELVICASVIFYIGDLCLDYWIMVQHFQAKKISSGWFIIFCILIPNLYAGYKSLQWYLRAHAENQTNEPIKWVLRIIFFPVSPLLRYYDAWKYGRQSRIAWGRHKYKLEKSLFIEYLIESEEVAMLRLFIIFLEDAPIAVLNLKEIISLPLSQLDSKVTSASVVGVKLFCTMTLGVVHYISCNKMAWHGAHSEISVPPPKVEDDSEYGFVKRTSSIKGPSNYNWEYFGRLTVSAEVCVYIWQLLSIASRLVAYAMFAVIYQPWIWLLIFIRWFIHTVWIYMDVKVLSLVNSIAFGVVYLFSYITTSPQRQIINIILYYAVTLCEDIIIAILWVHASPPDNGYGPGALGIVFGAAFGGMIFMCIYYACLHPRHDKTSFFVWMNKRRKEQVNQVA